MARNPRFIPDNPNGTLVEITSRAIEGQALLVPHAHPGGTHHFNEIVVGVMGRAHEISPIELCGAVFLTNHFHILAIVQDQQSLSCYMQQLQGNLSKEVGRIRNRSGTMWGRRYDAIVVSDEPLAQWKRLEYLLSHGPKEGLVRSPTEWPGVHCASALVNGESLEGYWFNHTKESAARYRGLKPGRYDYATHYVVEFSPLPAFRHLSQSAYQQEVDQAIRKIEKKYERERNGDPVAGVSKVLSTNPFQRPTRRPPKRAPRPLFHAHTPLGREILRITLRDFLKQYWAAADYFPKTRECKALCSLFPAGCYPPRLPYTGGPPPPRPPAPPTRQLTVHQKKIVKRGPIPVVTILGRWSMVTTRGQPPRGQPPRGQPPP